MGELKCRMVHNIGPDEEGVVTGMKHNTRYGPVYGRGSGAVLSSPNTSVSPENCVKRFW